MTAAAPDLFCNDAATQFVAGLPCLRCFVQLRLVWTEGVAAIETPWGPAPCCIKHAAGAASEFGWRKLNVDIASALADLAAIARRSGDLEEKQRAARRVFGREHNRARGLPLADPVTPEQPKGKTP